MNFSLSKLSWPVIIGGALTVIATAILYTATQRRVDAFFERTKDPYD